MIPMTKVGDGAFKEGNGVRWYLILSACFVALGGFQGCQSRYLLISEASLHDLNTSVYAQREAEASHYREIKERLDALEARLVRNESQRQETADWFRRQQTTRRDFDHLATQVRQSLKPLESYARYLQEVSPPVETSPVRPNKQIIGEVENVYLQPPGVILKARIDTGATTSSLNALNIQLFERDGEEWVRFDLPGPDDENATTLERPLVREVVIIQSDSHQGEERPVVEMELRIGTVVQMTEFTLSDRTHLEFPVLVGRNE